MIGLDLSVLLACLFVCFCSSMDEIMKQRDPGACGPSYYEILGCDPLSSIEQIQAEFKHHALAHHPDKNPDSQDEAHRKFELILEAKETLTDPNLRKKYDHWLSSGIGMPWKKWLEFTSKSQIVFHWTVPKKDPAITEKAHSTAGPDSSQSSSHRPEHSQSSHTPAKDDLLHKFRTYQI